MTDSNQGQSTPPAQEQWTPRWIWARLWEIAREYLKTSLGILLWTVFLLFGGLNFLVYFWHIRFMPEMDLNSSLTLLAVSALTGGLLIIGLGFCLVVPGWIWKGMTKDQEALKSPLWFGFPAALVLVSFLRPVFTPRGWPVILVWIGISISPFLLFLVRHKIDFFRSWTRTTAFVFYWGFMLSGLALVGVLLSLRVLAINENLELLKYHVMLTTLQAMVFVVIWNFVIVIGPLSIKLLLTAAAALIFTLFFPLQLGTFVPNRVVSIYKLGNFKASLLVDETGCTIASKNGFQRPAGSKVDATSIPRTCSLPNVTILSRLGNTYYIRKDAKSGCFTIPRQHVLSWAVERDKECDAPCQ